MPVFETLLFKTVSDEVIYWPYFRLKLPMKTLLLIVIGSNDAGTL